ncbi:hypothetical protein [Jannaschia ovalis]|uniref:Uncharacterized protein n=1 Tax=Jannaschia ovalis TaxID=3038773 RepID=A0ABY8LD81_9RHOB|nr:hypothetical protein [Jannaschia sp. GRR-S6-38]WGH78148.1 hypothetical protein P8627_14090 [Jannaschia sp. GRR-S6-38]
MARSPGHVLDRAYAEALSSFTAEYAAFYDLSLNEMLDALANDWDNLTIIDSPLQNLALLKDAMDGSSVLNTLPQVNTPNETLMAVFLGVASDKTVPISEDTVRALSIILERPLTDAQIASLAVSAEAVRIAVLTGQG